MSSRPAALAVLCLCLSFGSLSFAPVAAQSRNDPAATGARQGAGQASDVQRRANDPGPKPSAGSPTLAGTWTGEYVCGQGVTGGRAILTARSTTTYDGRVEFFALAENPGVPSGSFRVTANLDPASQAVTFVPGAWIKQPPGYTTIGFKGIVDFVGGAIAGTIDGAGCASFVLNRS